MTEVDLTRMLEEAVSDYIIACPYCGYTPLEPDYGSCPDCGRENPLMSAGLI